MAKEDKREKAEKLYVQQSMTCPQIAEELGVNEGTVYRWKSEAAELGGAQDWNTQRRVYNTSPLEMFAMYAETFKSWLVEIYKNPALLANPKIADAIVKHMSALKKLDIRGQYKGVALDLLKVTNQWLAENQPELKTKLDPYWDGIYAALVKYAAEKGMF
ncbi:MAG: DUF1804 family protein [Treponema sp.]|jgi:hypothetical protein|nr:DUF1804 family protein [Treponema sp.]